MPAHVAVMCGNIAHNAAECGTMDACAVIETARLFTTVIAQLHALTL
jgi:hypothetical protein